MGLEVSLKFDKVFPLDGVCDEPGPCCEPFFGTSDAGSKALGLKQYSLEMPLEGLCALELMSKAGRPGWRSPAGSVSGGRDRTTIFTCVGRRGRHLDPRRIFSAAKWYHFAINQNVQLSPHFSVSCKKEQTTDHWQRLSHPLNILNEKMRVQQL